jgi:UDP-N-acetylmuramoyl-L-alanyl-D-glutamate--2,6-diaminopimelate ligase
VSGVLLSEVAAAVPGARVVGHDVSVRDVFHDSRRVASGTLFAVRRGEHRDGRAFVRTALDTGAVALLVDDVEIARAADAPAIVVPDVRAALGVVAARVYGEPFARLCAVGVTGTNGKTTTTFLVAAMLERLGARPAVVGTLGVTLGGHHESGSHTTPEADDLARTARDLVARGATHLVMEVSSHALAQHRADAVKFRVAAFTNLTHDHLDFHGTLGAYGEAKARLFEALAPASSVINVDDPFGQSLTGRAHGRVVSVSARGAEATLRVTRTDASPEGTTLAVTDGAREISLRSPLVGAHNAENLMVALGIAAALDHDLVAAAQALGAAPAVPGRLERCSAAGDDVLVLVDYAHTPDALERALAAVRPLTRGAVWCVFGCGGDRDAQKRPRMGEAAVRGADRLLVTNDNPRSEDPRAIADAIVGGVVAAGGACDVVLDRAAAIELAVLSAAPGDVILVAGKGHEPYQIVGTEVRAFDDRDEARRALASRREVA